MTSRLMGIVLGVLGASSFAWIPLDVTPTPKLTPAISLVPHIVSVAPGSGGWVVEVVNPSGDDRSLVVDLMDPLIGVPVHLAPRTSAKVLVPDGRFALCPHTLQFRLGGTGVDTRIRQAEISGSPVFKVTVTSSNVVYNLGAPVTVYFKDNSVSVGSYDCSKTVTAKVTVVNTGNAAQDATVYLTDLTNRGQSAVHVPAKSEASVSVATTGLATGNVSAVGSGLALGGSTATGTGSHSEIKVTHTDGTVSVKLVN